MPRRRPPLRAVLFDLDGTLADSLPIILDSFVEAFALEGFAFTRDEVNAHGGPPFREMVRALAGDVTEDRFARIAHGYGEAFRARERLELRPMPGALALLDSLAARGVPLALVTNRGADSATSALSILGWQDRFAAVVCSDHVANPKPAPDAARHALRLLGLTPEATAYVGDHEADIVCARAAGIPLALGLTADDRRSLLLAAGASHVADTLDELATHLLL